MTYFYIWSIEHQAWWHPNEMGYTQNLAAAGLYTAADCARILARANLITTNEAAIPERCLQRKEDEL